MRRIGIIGSRNFPNREMVEQYVRELKNRGEHIVVYSGGAPGVDTWVEDTALINDIPFVRVEADWTKYGKGAGPIRNGKLVKLVDELVAFWDGKSPGTHNAVQIAKSQEKTVTLYVVDKEEER